ncbi:MAG: tetratricopeptide repeat protein [Alphaproteobacteria bacterium]|nr:tetratricopeptide repeat protein [Alphaproteobacteria bacterium]MDE2337591.1 tetratricopeptide repeat protein [Alphaproteobacteria bacterium]
MNKIIRTSTIALSLTALLGVTACKMNNAPVVGKALDGISGMHDETEARLATSAHNAIAAGKTQEALALYTKLYSQNGTADVALNYAQLLRKTGSPQKALDILKPFAVNGDGTVRDAAAPVMLNEYAAASIELGHYHAAEISLEKVLKSKQAFGFHADANDLLGVALDAQGWHQEAERDYKSALKDWKGDPTPVMNNLGLCLAAQGLFDESLAMLRQALVKAPHNAEIARNIDMVSRLRKDFVPTAPITIEPPPAAHRKK